MPDTMSLHGRNRRLPAQPMACVAKPTDAPELWGARRQKAREALQEAIFALQITHARTSIVIEKIEHPESREKLLAQSARIGNLIDLAWCRLGDI
ncbi:hypothetical protein [Bradyrhizobium acaciae]|uniref:hypothetical protein n=1 Tax=Bradyrhizobium acaciae TaxID=2683706 RepID=UPI001E5A1B87|nr:hypothetical protein [Bradyrhizobium acaciae]MCC8978374.1 hypothetical protein [Bradyrhizobium acaciae]